MKTLLRLVGYGGVIGGGGAVMISAIAGTAVTRVFGAEAYERVMQGPKSLIIVGLSAIWFSGWATVGLVGWPNFKRKTQTQGEQC